LFPTVIFAGQQVLFRVITICLEWNSKPLVQFFAFNIKIYFTIFKNVLEIFSYVSQPRATCNKHDYIN